MAIDDNKIYGIKGSQLKDLASKVNAKAESSSLATVATSGDYDDLTNKPTIPTVNNATLTIQKNSTTIDTFTANASADKTINITVPTKVSDITNDAGYQNASDVSTAVGNETTARQAADTSLQGQIDAIVASSDVKDIVGTKTDLDNYDTSTLGNNDIIKVLTDSSQSNATTYYRWSTSTSAFSLIGSEGPYYTKSATDTLLNAKADQSTTYTKSEVDTALAAKVNTSSLATVATTGSYSDLSNKPSLATVATSGSYNDLSNKPTIPTVNNATLTIQYNGSSAGTFTANASANKTISITPAVKVGSVLSTPSSVAYVNTANITDSAVTTAKIAATAVTTAKLADGSVTAAKTSFGGNYSTSEVDTGFTWIDGKTIYKKTVDCGKLPNNSAKSIPHSIPNIGTVVEMRGTASNGSITFPIPFVSRSNVSDQIEIQVNLTDVSASTHTDYWYNNNYSGYVTIYYTKSS